MKKLIAILFFSLSLNAFSQIDPIIDNSTGKAVYVETIINDLSKANLYKNAQGWITKVFSNYKSVVESENYDIGRIVLKPKLYEEYSDKMQISFNFTLTLDCKDNKYRYTFSDVYFYYNSVAMDSPMINTLDDKMKKYLQDNDKAPIDEVTRKLLPYFLSLKETMAIKDDF